MYYVFVAITLSLFSWLIVERKRKRIPGPNLFTDLFCATRLTEEAKDNLYVHYLKLSKLFGPIFRVRVDGRETVVVTDRDLAHAALVGKPDDFAGRPRDTMFKNSGQESNDLGTAPYNERFRLVKKAAGKALWGYMSRNNLEKRVEFVCGELTKLWRKERVPFDPRKELAYPGVGVCLGAMFNTDYSPTDGDYVYVRDNMEAFISLDTTGEGATQQLVQQVGDEYPRFMRGKIDRVAANAGDKAESIVEHLLVEQRDNDDISVRHYLRDNMEYLLTDLMGGNITVHSTMIWMIFFLAKHRDVQEKVYHEILQVIGPTNLICLRHRQHMCYTMAVLHEIMRRGTITPIGFPHTTTADTRLGGYDIPMGTDLTFHFYAYHHDPKQFPRPETFDPERFLVRNGDQVGEHVARVRALMPFSAGRRKCPAEMIARPELFMIMCHLVRTWDIQFPPGDLYSDAYSPSRYSVAGLPHQFKIQPKLRNNLTDD